MPYPNYTESDIQEYATGSYKGDILLFEDYLDKNAAARKEIEIYKLIIQNVKEAEISPLQYDMGASIIFKLRAKQKRNAQAEGLWKIVITGLFLLFLILSTFYMLSFIVIFDITLMVSILLIIIFSALFNYAELKRKNDIYNNSYNRSIINLDS